MKILMVCLGNICRSPLAHGVMQHLVNAEGLGWQIDSAGTGGWHVGNAPDRRSIAIAKLHGIDISHQRAQQFNTEHLVDYDFVLAMDRNNLRHILSKADTIQQRARIQLFLEDDEVPDPYHDDDLFEPVYQLIAARCEVLINVLRNEATNTAK